MASPLLHSCRSAVQHTRSSLPALCQQGSMDHVLEQCTHLVVWEDQCIGNHHVLRPGGRKDNNLCNIVSGQRIDTPGIPVRISTAFTAFEARHTHRRHRPWPCHRSIEQSRTPVTDQRKRSSTSRQKLVPFPPALDQSQCASQSAPCGERR